MPTSRNTRESDVDQIVQLAISVSGRLTRLRGDEAAPAIAELLEAIAAATRADQSRLIEFTASGSVAHTHARASAPGASDYGRVPDGWLAERLARGESVAITRPDDLPREATAAREIARRTGVCSVLGVPASVAGQVVCALVLDSTRATRRWSPELVERLQLLVEILAGWLQRSRDEHSLRANVSMIERLNARLEADNVCLKEEIKSRHDFDDIVGESAALHLALARVSQVAPTNSSVLLLGPTGTGKELFARAVHERSRRHQRALVRVNCAALPPTLIESELFGHEKGAFTGAVGLRKGRFELADGGTIFLDEIGDLTPEVQAKFLRVLQEGEFERVGSSITKKVDVRVIAATHQDLEEAVAAGRFRADLYYRLSVYPIRLPCLRDRPDDIPRLVWFFIHRHQRELGRQITKVPQAVMDALRSHTWPGNVRELENVVERAMIATNGDTLHLDEPFVSGRRETARIAGTDNLDSVQRVHIEGVLEQCGWRISGTGNAADRLGVHPNTLRFRMKKLGMACPARISRTHQAARARALETGQGAK